MGPRGSVKGPGFIGVHLLPDQATDPLREGADLMAERAVILGGLARGPLGRAASGAEVDAYPDDAVRIEDHMAALLDRFEEAGDAGTSGLLADIGRQIDMGAWFIGANLAPREVAEPQAKQGEGQAIHGLRPDPFGDRSGSRASDLSA